MAERTVSVKLSARVEQYIAAMRAAEASTTGLSRSGIRAIGQLGQSIQNVGASMTRYMTVPLAALAGGAVYMAANFDTAFAQMVGLANVPASEVDHLKESVLALAGETARAPQELADGLYLAASSGLDSAAAMDVVTTAAKGAAAGMGTTDDIVKLLTSAIGSYGSANITASQAADVLSAAIRDGRAEPEEMAQTMGRILPVAAQMGVSFGQVGGALAFLTNTGIETDQAVTGLRAGLINLYVPGKQAQNILTTMGTSADELRAAIRENGLMGALDLLREHGFNGNVVALRKLLPEVRGLNAIMPLLADETGTLDQIMGDTVNSAGSLDFAFAAVSGTAGFKLKKALTDVKVAMINIGDILLPIAATVATAISDMVNWFAKLPKPIQDAALVLGALAAATGPVVYMAGSLLKNWGLLNVVFNATVGSGSRVVSALSGVAIAIGVAYAAWKILDEGHLNATGHIDTAADALQRSTEQAWLEAAAAAGASGQVDALAVAHRALGQAILEQADGKLSEWFSALNISGDMALDTLINLKEWGGSNAHAQEFLADALGLTIDQMDMLSSIVHSGFKEGDITQEMRDGLGMTNDQIMAVGGALVGLQGYAIENTGELDDMARASLDATVALGGTGRAAVIAAEGIAGSRLETGNAVDVYEEYIRQLTLIDPEAAAAAVSVDHLGGSISGANEQASTGIPLWGSLWTSVSAGAAKAVDALGGQRAALDKLTGGVHNAAEAQAALAAIAEMAGHQGEHWVTYAESVSGASRAGDDALLVYQTLLSALGRLTPNIEAEVRAQLGLTGAYQKGATSAAQFAKSAKDLGAAIDGLEGVKFAADAIKKLGDAAEEAATSNLADLIDEMFSFATAADAAMMAADTFRSELERLRKPANDLRSSTRDVWTEIDAMSDSLDKNGTTLGVATQAGRDNQVQLEATTGAIFDHAAALLENGASAETAAADIAYNVKQLDDQWRAAGATEGQIELLNAQYGLTPEQVTTYLELLGDKTAKAQIGAYTSDLNKIPAVIPTAVNAYPTGVSYTKGQINSITAPRSVPITPYLTKSSFTVQIHTNTTSTYLKSAAGRFVPGGSNMLSTLGEVSGSRGDEVVLPLGDKARMSQLLGMDGVGSRVAAAMAGWAPMHGWSGGGGGGGGGSIMNVTVNMPPGANGDDVVRALKQYQRRSGPVPITTR